MDASAPAVGFLGILVGALIGWFAGLAVARRSRDYAIELWQLDRTAREADLRRALGDELRGNISLLRTAREKSHHGLLQRSAWTAGAGMNFKQDQSRQLCVAAYVAGAQYDTTVRQIPAMGGGNIRSEATNLASDLAKVALEHSSRPSGSTSQTARTRLLPPGRETPRVR